jgi:hypothetical protein
MKYSDRDLEEMFDEALDECREPVKLGCLSYDVSIVLKRVDPIAYRQDFLHYLDLLMADRIVFEHTDGSYHDRPEDEPNESRGEFEIVVVVDDSAKNRGE